MVGEQTFEEIYTGLTQIEAVVKSRLLCSLSSDPHELSILRSEHFLVHEPITYLPSSLKIELAISMAITSENGARFLEAMAHRISGLLTTKTEMV